MRSSSYLKWFTSLLLGFLSFVVALLLADAIGRIAQDLGATETIQLILTAAVITMVTVPAIYLLRTRFDGLPWRTLGLTSLTSPASWQESIGFALLGAGFAIIMASVGLVLASLLGWIRITEFHFSGALLGAILLNLVIAFFLEAFPEEIAFRGYLFRTLNSRLSTTVAFILQPILFSLIPVAVTFLQMLLGMEAESAIALDNILFLYGFGTVLQMLRIVTGNLWANIGFHLAFLEISRFVLLPRELKLMTIEENIPGIGLTFVQGIMVIGMGTLVLLAWSILRKQPIDWENSNADLQA